VNAKFRGQRKDIKEWVYGDLLRSGERRFIVPDGGFIAAMYVELIGCIEVIPSSVGQFTGKLDDHEKEIYDGSRLKIGRCPTISHVYWDSEVAAWKITALYANEGNRLLSDVANDYHNIATVIGTIHDGGGK
jgi:hypothetical protein